MEEKVSNKYEYCNKTICTFENVNCTWIWSGAKRVVLEGKVPYWLASVESMFTFKLTDYL